MSLWYGTKPAEACKKVCFVCVCVCVCVLYTGFFKAEKITESIS